MQDSLEIRGVPLRRVPLIPITNESVNGDTCMLTDAARMESLGHSTVFKDDSDGSSRDKVSLQS